ncbi:MAG: hypothetical protein AAFQ02_01285 [Bacteroidota bacterium]
MKQDYPAQQIIKYLYNELDAPEHLETEYAIRNDPEWMASYVVLRGGYEALPQQQYLPKNRVIRSILAYSRA